MVTTYNYDSTVPAANNAPKNDQPTMQSNAASIQGLISVDHVNFGSSTNGYHTAIHLVDNGGSNPSKVSGTGILWNNNVTFNGNTDEALFFRGNTGGASNIIQLTAPYGFSAIKNGGYVFIPGGIIWQWGFITLPGTANPSASQSFPINFPNQCFQVQLTLDANVSTSQPNTAFVIGTPGTSSFVWGFTGSTSYNYIYWSAVGY